MRVHHRIETPASRNSGRSTALGFLARVIIVSMTRRALPTLAHCVFVARLKIEKGIPELVESFQSLALRFPELWLLLVGGVEDSPDRVPEPVLDLIRSHPRIWHAGYQRDVERYLAMMDIFALPSHREGLPNVVLQASAMGLPVITCDTMGCREAAADGETAILVPVGDPQALAAAIDRLARDAFLRRRLGRQGRRRVEALFDQRKLWPALEAVYRELLSARGLPLPSAEPPRSAERDVP